MLWLPRLSQARSSPPAMPKSAPLPCLHLTAAPFLPLFHLLFFFFFVLRSHSFIFRDRGREGERKGKKHQCVVVSHMPPNRDLARNLGMCPAWESSQQHFGSQAGAHALSHASQGTHLLFYEHSGRQQAGSWLSKCRAAWGQRRRPFLELTCFPRGFLSLLLCHTPRQGSAVRQAQTLCLRGPQFSSIIYFLFSSLTLYDTVNSSQAKQCLKTPKGE